MVDRPTASTAGLPRTQHAIRFVGPGQVVHERSKPVVEPGPTQIVARVEAVGICFSDTKLLHAFSAHPRKSEVVSGIDPAVLAGIPSYVPGDLPTVPGHEVVCRIVAVGSEVRHHRVGERCLVQTDYRHLPTAVANAAFGYDFEGGLQEYVLMDERMILEPGTGERFLIPVSDEPSASAVALLEPWACVEASYSHHERNGLLPAGRLLVVVASGHRPVGLEALVAAARPATIAVLAEDDADLASVASMLSREPEWIAGFDALPGAAFDDAVYFGATPAHLERLQEVLAPFGVLDVALGGRRLGRPVAVDVGRVHYDRTRWTGTPGSSASSGYGTAPPDGEIRDGDRIGIIGAAGPMGVMHVVRAITSGRAGLIVTAIDIDPDRLAHLATVAGPLARDHGVRLEIVDSRTEPPRPGFDYIAVMVPSPAIAAQAVALAGEHGRINLFAGFALGTRAPLDVDLLLERRAYLLGTSGSAIPDMRAVLSRLEQGLLDTNVSVDAVSGMEGVADALAAVEARTSGGKIVVYPALHETGLIRLSEMARRDPAVAAALDGGRWTRAAEDALLQDAGEEPAR
jgi:threonine dehydrogenase-like Zn-dependent dehydrogenase